MKTGFIYSIQRYCIHDGPGIRTNIFFKGCQLKCPWCSNPESQLDRKEISFAASKCVKCGLCAKKCPRNAVQMGEKQRIDFQKCDLCGICALYCPKECYQIYGREITAEELMEEVERDLPYYRNSGGGVTVTGGEPTLQWEFLEHFLKDCKEGDLDTAMETHGYAPCQVMKRLAPYVDHFLIDIKHMDSSLHEQITGAPNERILDNIRMLAGSLEKEVSLRLPCILGFNMDEENQEAVKRFAKEIAETGKLKMIHLLPYHNLGMGKYEALGRKYRLEALPSMKEETLKEYEGKLKREGLPVIIGG